MKSFCGVLVVVLLACGGAPEVVSVQPLPQARETAPALAPPAASAELHSRDASGSTYELQPTARPQAASEPTIGAPATAATPVPQAPAAPAPATANLAAFDACHGTLNRSRAQRAISRVETDLAQCYATGFERDPSQRGDIRLVLKIETNGRMSDGAVSGDITDRAILDCMLDTLRAVRFPRPRRGCATVVQTYSFNPH